MTSPPLAAPGEAPDEVVRRITERHDASFSFVFDATAILEERNTGFQDALVIDTLRHGRVFFLDGLTMLTERTHHVYHEAMALAPLSCVDAPKRVLIVGGGDGGVATEACKWPGVEEIVVADLDGEVATIAKRWFPDVAKGFDDPRVQLRVGDGAAFVAEHSDAFDVIVVDSTDITLPDEVAPDSGLVASPLATRAFHDALRGALRPGGVGVQIVGSPVFYPSSIRLALDVFAPAWPHFTFMAMPTPFYITGPWVAAVFAKDHEPEPRHWRLGPDADLQFMSHAMARAVLTLPADLQRQLDAPR